MNWIDLRSDTVTKPTQAMRRAMYDAEVGDDVYGEDPAVNRLERLAAETLATEAAVFAPSGTQTNLIALLSHCTRGDEYIVGQSAHTYKYEGGGAAVLGSIQPQPLEFEQDGTLDLDKVRAVIKPDDIHFAKTRLLCLENTWNGLALPVEYPARAREFVNTHNLKLHLDGARVFNAAVKLNIPVQEIAGHFDSISVCLSKGLGAPVGSLLCSDAEVISNARRWRKVLGGGMRQAGVLAAAGIHALENNVDRLVEDHENAAFLAGELDRIEELTVDFQSSQTNMVFIELREDGNCTAFRDYLRESGIIISDGPMFRLVTHLDVDREDMKKVVEVIKDFFKGQKSNRPDQ